MPTIMTHAVVGVGLGRIFTPRKMPLLFWETLIVLAMLPDADAFTFAFGIDYGSFWGHRGFSHSLCFALVVSLLVTALTYRHFQLRFLDLWGLFFAVTASHGILDAFTNGGLGIAFFAPLDNARYFFPWRPLTVSPIGGSFFSMHGLQTIHSELLWVWLPTLVLVGAVEVYRRIKARREP